MQYKQNRGFTIVELLIVIVIIAILMAVTVVAYNGIQTRGRDARRAQDIAQITKALELYYVVHDRYPAGDGSTTLNTSWSTTADASWSNLATALKPYASNLPSDPISTPNAAMTGGAGYNYAYFSHSSSFCGAGPYKMYILIYKFEAAPQVNTREDTCVTAPTVGLYANIVNHRVVKK